MRKFPLEYVVMSLGALAIVATLVASALNRKSNIENRKFR